jgi:alpha-glucosidase
MKRSLVLAFLSVITGYYAIAKEFKLASPDNKISVTVTVGTDIMWSATCEGRELINNSKIAMILANGKILGENEKVKKAAISQLNDIIRPVVSNKKSVITDNCIS